jgi:hypothetical protein
VTSLAGSYQVENKKYFYHDKLTARTMMFLVLLVMGASIDVGTTISIDHFYCKWEEEEKL